MKTLIKFVEDYAFVITNLNTKIIEEERIIKKGSILDATVTKDGYELSNYMIVPSEYVTENIYE